MPPLLPSPDRGESPRLNLLVERSLTLAQAATLLPRRRGRKVSGVTVWRWAVRGYKGIRLEALRQPGGWITTAEAVHRFLEALAERERREKAPEPTAGETPQRERERAQAREILDRAGI